MTERAKDERMDKTRLTQAQRALIMFIEVTLTVPEAELKQLILEQLQDHQAYSVQDVIDHALELNANLYESDVKSVLLGLVRRNQLDFTDDFKVQLRQDEPALAG